MKTKNRIQNRFNSAEIYADKSIQKISEAEHEKNNTNKICMEPAATFSTVNAF